MSANSSVLAPSKQGRSVVNRPGRQTMGWLAVAAAALLVALGAWAINAGQTATTSVAPPTGLRTVPHQAIDPAAGGPALVVSGTNGGGIVYTGIPYPAPGRALVSSGQRTVPHQAISPTADGPTLEVTSPRTVPHQAIDPTAGGPALVVSGTNGGGIEYTGIPYPAPGPALVVSGTNGGGIEYTGIPYPAPGER